VKNERTVLPTLENVNDLSFAAKIDPDSKRKEPPRVRTRAAANCL
jgi:hypothetical protein